MSHLIVFFAICSSIFITSVAMECNTTASLSASSTTSNTSNTSLNNSSNSNTTIFSTTTAPAQTLSPIIANCSSFNVTSSNHSFPISFDDFVLAMPDASLNESEANYCALVSAADEILENVETDMFGSELSILLFLASIAHDTDQLASHNSWCLRDTDHTCTPTFDTALTNDDDKFSNGSTSFHPRGALMMSTRWNYAALQQFLIQRNVSNVANLVAQPNLVAESLVYSYRSAVFLWTQAANVCAFHTHTLADVGECVRALNAWECTENGHADFEARMTHLARIALALDSHAADELDLNTIKTCAVDSSSSLSQTLPSTSSSSSLTSSSVSSSASSSSLYSRLPSSSPSSSSSSSSSDVLADLIDEWEVFSGTSSLTFTMNSVFIVLACIAAVTM